MDGVKSLHPEVVDGCESVNELGNILNIPSQSADPITDASILPSHLAILLSGYSKNHLLDDSLCRPSLLMGRCTRLTEGKNNEPIPGYFPELRSPIIP